MKTQCLYQQGGMTLVELTVVLMILMALAGLAVPYVMGTGSTAMCQTTDATMQTVKEAIMGGPAGAGYYADLLGQYPRDKGIPAGYSLHYLFARDDVKNNDGDSNMPSSDGVTNVDPEDEWRAYNPKTGIGWRGPYLMSGALLDTITLANLDASFGTEYNPASPATDAYVHVSIKSYDGSDADTTATVEEAAQLSQVLDAWHRPIVLQIPYDGTKLNIQYARLVSAGSDERLNTLIADTVAEGRNNPDDPADKRYTNDDRVLYLKMPDPSSGGNRPCDLY